MAVGSALEENREHGAGRLVEQRHRARLLKAQARLNPYLAALDELARGIGAGLPLDQWRGEDCRTFALNIDMPQYACSIAFILSTTVY